MQYAYIDKNNALHSYKLLQLFSVHFICRLGERSANKDIKGHTLNSLSPEDSNGVQFTSV